ncbi:MAG TPA: hypothetical protein VNH18_10430 [Bryobacteraceae bacterium]|nr:hypothetical protein [Bryobacteraceae bacterium]
MSLAGYFTRNGSRTVVPRGMFRSTGTVLSGEKSVEEGRRDVEEAALRLRSRTGGASVYRAVSEYDAVLADHCRLK